MAILRYRYLSCFITAGRHLCEANDIKRLRRTIEVMELGGRVSLSPVPRRAGEHWRQVTMPGRMPELTTVRPAATLALTGWLVRLWLGWTARCPASPPSPCGDGRAVLSEPDNASWFSARSPCTGSSRSEGFSERRDCPCRQFPRLAGSRQAHYVRFPCSLISGRTSLPSFPIGLPSFGECR